MSERHVFRTKIIIWISLLFALFLQAIPWPGKFEAFRPDWVLLIMFYWALALPHRANVGTALITGLIWDLALGSTLGIHSMIMSILVYIVATNFQIILNMRLWQQGALFALLTALAEVVEFYLEYLIQDITFNPHYLWGSCINFILWPWLFLFLRNVRRRWRMV